MRTCTLFLVLLCSGEALASPLRPRLHLPRGVAPRFANTSTTDVKPTLQSEVVELTLRLSSQITSQDAALAPTKSESSSSYSPSTVPTSTALTVGPAHDRHDEPMQSGGLPTASIPDQNFDFVNRNPPPKSSANVLAPSKYGEPSKSSTPTVSKSTTSVAGDTQQPNPRSSREAVTVTVIKTVEPVVRPTQSADANPSGGRRKGLGNRLSSSEPAIASETRSVGTSVAVIRSSSNPSIARSSSGSGFPGTSSVALPSSTPDSGSSSNSGQYTINKKDALEANKRFANLQSEGSCNDGDMACLDGAIVKCQGGKYTVNFKCSPPTKCFALPFEVLIGYNIACAEPKEAARLLGVDESSLSGGSGDGSYKGSAIPDSSSTRVSTLSKPLQSTLSKSPISVSASFISTPTIGYGSSQPASPTKSTSRGNGAQESARPNISTSAVSPSTTAAFGKASTPISIVIITSTKVETSTAVVISTSVITSVVTRTARIGMPNGIIGIPAQALVEGKLAP